MNQEQIFQKVTEIIQERQGKDFVIEISDEDVDRFENVADIVAYLEKKLAK